MSTIFGVPTPALYGQILIGLSILAGHHECDFGALAGP